MKTFNKIWTLIIFLSFSIFGLIGSTSIAATTPSLGEAARFGVLSSTLSITTATTVNGDAGYTTLSNPGLTVVGGTIFMPPPPQAGTDQGTALTNLNGQACTFTFAAGAIDLATDITHGTIGIYTGGVYCIDGAVSIGSAGITLSGAGTYIFRTLGTSNSLTTVDNSVVTLTAGASACDVFWTPTAATTLGANTTFIGTVIDDAGITVGSTTSWIGRALAFAETVTTNGSTITNTCGGAAGTGTLHVIKTVVGGTAIASDFRLYVNYNGTVVGSGQGTGGLGTLYSLTAGTYTVSEDTNGSYTQSLSANCSNVTLLSGDDKTCTITNTYIIPPSGGGGGGGSLSKDNCPNGDYSYSYYDKECGTAPIVTGNVIITTGNVIITTGNVVSTGTVIIDNTVSPGFPKTGLPPQGNNTFPWNIIILISIITAFTSFVIVLRKRVI